MSVTMVTERTCGEELAADGTVCGFTGDVEVTAYNIPAAVPGGGDPVDFAETAWTCPECGSEQVTG